MGVPRAVRHTGRQLRSNARPYGDSALHPHLPAVLPRVVTTIARLLACSGFLIGAEPCEQAAGSKAGLADRMRRQCDPPGIDGGPPSYGWRQTAHDVVALPGAIGLTRLHLYCQTGVSLPTVTAPQSCGARIVPAMGVRRVDAVHDCRAPDLAVLARWLRAS